MFATLGLGIVIGTLLYALWFHASWRKESARGRWPAPVYWSVGGALTMGLGLMLGSWMLVAAGCVTHMHGRRSARRLGQD